MSAPAISVIVPTCDRPGPLAGCLKTLVEQDCEGLEILVSDNAGSPETARVIKEFNDPRLRMLRVEKRLGMPEHFEFALGHARGEWVTFLGDDDGMLPGAASRVLQLASEWEVDAICALRCSYQWPEATCTDKGQLMVRRPRENRLCDSRRAITRVMQGRAGYGSLPWIYTGGYVRRSVMETIRARMGRYFSSMNLDAYSGLAVGSVCPRYLRCGEVLAIEGTCAASNGKLWLDGKKLKKSEFSFLQETDLEFHPALGDGNVFSMPLLVYEAFLQSAPLRDFEIDTDLSRQLQLALVSAKKKVRPAVEEYCRKVAVANGLDFEPLLSRVRLARLEQSARKKCRKAAGTILRSRADWLSKVCSADISDVHQASVTAGQLLASARGR